ncbi:non-ribosomal peptide synthetase [Paenibacillus sp. FSL R7-0345]|uniref:non-ribosomal peptide synthetase n=1 Tax=Paenibacillus sp. FSL R7-0345 TaxID=2954535 RepID=UPI00315AD093
MTISAIDNLYQKSKAYWLEQLRDVVETTSFPYCSDEKSFTAVEQYEFTFNENTSARLLAVSNQSEAALYVILLGSIQYLLQRYTNSTLVTVGIPYTYSSAEAANLLLLKTDFSHITRFTELLKELADHVKHAVKHPHYPIAKLAEDIKLDQTGMAYAKTMVGLSSLHHHLSTLNRSEIEFMFKVNEGVLGLAVKYQTGLFTESYIEQICGHLHCLFDLILSEPDVCLNEIDLIGHAERKVIMEEFNNTAMPYTKSLIHSIFEHQVIQTPHNTALLFDHQQMSYLELNQKSNQLARALRLKGVKANSFVGIKMERSIEMIIGILAILKAGGAYVPIDPEFPAERIKFMLEDTHMKIILAKDHQNLADHFQGEIIHPGDHFEGDDSNLDPVNQHSDLAYVIYTSGSTGRPKGVMIAHDSVINRLLWMQDQFPINEEDTILQKTPYTFDVSVWELFWWFFAGARLSLLKPGGEKEPKEIINAISSHGVTTMHFVPSMLNVFLEYLKAKEDAGECLVSLRTVFASGEALKSYQVEKYRQLIYMKHGTKLINLYGPTEATVDVTYYDCDFSNIPNPIPIGKPIYNTQLYILDAKERPQPVGVAGELCIAGDGLAKGYLNLPELTDAKFKLHLIKSGEKRIYKTGDLARWLPNGNIEYLGRLDYQVKIRGYRIELEEIETRLLENPSIRESIVLAVENEQGDKELCAYYVADNPISPAEIIAYLSQSLPYYMIPSFCRQIELMPVSANGKMDRSKLTNIFNDSKAVKCISPPESAMEQKIAAVWSNVLKIENIDIHADFFQTGGNSLKAVLLEVELEKEGLRPKELLVYARKTIYSMAQYFESL